MEYVTERRWVGGRLLRGSRGRYALEDVWSRDATRIRDQLHDAVGDDRFALAIAKVLRRYEAGDRWIRR